MIRSLRPLQRRIPSTRHFRLHEAETSERIAAAAMGRGSWLPARYPMPERWLDLVILVDGAPSMALWQQTVDEFIALLANTGIFRNVQRWTLAVVERDGAVNDERKTELHLYPAQVAPGSTHRRHAVTELLDQQQRRLFVVISDCSSIVWDSGAAQQLLQPLAAHNLVSLVQVLPEELWKTTALRLAEETRLTTSRALSANAEFVAGQGRRGLALPIPVVSLEPEPLHLWAGFLAGRERRTMVGYYLPVVADVAIDVEQALLALGITPQPPQETETDGAAADLYDRFREYVPQRVRPLAAYFAAAPLTLPVMRMVQATMLPQTTHADFVRVFYSGLIRRQTAQTVDRDGSDMVYDFVGGDEMREFLLTRLPRYSAEQVVDLVIAELSRFVQEHLDKLGSFDTMIAVQGGHGPLSVNATAHHFAEVTTKVLRYLGGVYAVMADNLEQFVLPKWIRIDLPIFSNALTEQAEALLQNSYTDVDAQDHPTTAIQRVKDILHDQQIIVFTPHGDQKRLPKGATALDFAYAVHTEVGNYAREAYINEVQVPLNQPLRDGDIVEIRKGRSGPQRVWLEEDLEYMHTSYARAISRRWFRHLRRRQALSAGKLLLDDELTMLGLEEFSHWNAATLLDRATAEDLHAALGFAEILPMTMATRILSTVWNMDVSPQVGTFVHSKDGQGFFILNIINVPLRLCNACMPRPAMPIVGYKHVDGRVSIHRETCYKLPLHVSKRRLIQLNWGKEGEGQERHVNIQISVYVSPNLLIELTRFLQDEQINSSIYVPEASPTGATKDNEKQVFLSLNMSEPRKLVRILHRIKALVNVLSVRCVNPSYKILPPSMYRPE